jgi:hypothetical protein
MWLPIFKYLLKFAKPGMFAFKSTGQEYEGAYVETNTGKLYAGNSPTDTKEELVATDSDAIRGRGITPLVFESDIVYPNPADYERGYMIRYFLKNNTSGKIIEVTSSNFTKLNSKPYYKGSELKWILDKPAKDVFNQGYVFNGAITRNKANTKQVSFIIKGLDIFITEYDQFVNIESDVKGFKFEELPKNEKIRIIKQQRPNIQKIPKVKPKPFKRPKVNPTLNETPTPLVSAPSAPTNSGGGGGGGLNQSFDEVINDPDNLSMGNNNQNNNSANNYY